MTTNIHIDFQKMIEIMAIGARRASAFMAVGLRAADERAINSIELDTNNHISFFPDDVGQDTISEIKLEFADWVIANGLRELDQFLAVFCDEIYTSLTYLSAHGTKLNPKHIELVQEFKEGTSTSGKLSKIREEFGVDGPLSKHFRALSSARNCLTHNLGIVAKRHCSIGDTLELTWSGQDMVVGDKVISDKFEPINVKKGEIIEFRSSDRSKTFNLNSKITLKPRDLAEICWTYQRHSVAIVKATENKVRERGIEVAEKKL